MKICDVVMNTIHYDPRVNRQIEMYNKMEDIELTCVGLMDNQYSEEKLEKYSSKITIVKPNEKYNKKMRTPIGKIIREIWKNILVRDAIIANDPDVIHANDLDALIPAMMAASRLECKVVYDSHEICTDNLWLLDKKLYRRYLQILEKHLVKKIDLMVCVSHAAADYFEEKYGIEKPMVITNCAILNNCLSHNKNKHEGFEILNHGQFYEGRGYDIMVESIPYLHDASEISLALRGFGKMEKYLRARAKELGENSIRFYPKVPVHELIPLATKSHVGVAITEAICLNFELSVSNKLFEYVAAGIPVILSDIPEHRYLNDKYNFGIILPENTPEEFAKAVMCFYSNKEFYNKCAENARKLAEEINWENEFNKLIEYEKSMLL